MAVECFAGRGVDAWGVQPDKHHAQFREMFDGIGGEGGEVVAPAVWPGMHLCPDQNPLRHVCQNRSQVIDAYRSEEHTSELQSLMRISYAVFCLKKKNKYTYLHKL